MREIASQIEMWTPCDDYFQICDTSNPDKPIEDFYETLRSIKSYLELFRYMGTGQLLIYKHERQNGVFYILYKDEKSITKKFYFKLFKEDLEIDCNVETLFIELPEFNAIFKYTVGPDIKSGVPGDILLNGRLDEASKPFLRSVLHGRGNIVEEIGDLRTLTSEAYEQIVVNKKIGKIEFVIGDVTRDRFRLMEKMGGIYSFGFMIDYDKYNGIIYIPFVSLYERRFDEEQQEFVFPVKRFYGIPVPANEIVPSSFGTFSLVNEACNLQIPVDGYNN